MNYKPLVIAGTVFLVIGSLFLLTSMNRTINTATTTNTVSFSGEGKVVAKPDVAVVSMAIVTEAASSKAAQDSNSQKSKALSDFLKNQGVSEDDIKTTGYNIYPQYTYPQFSQPQIRGYQVTQSVEVKIRDLDKVSTILDGAVAAGANQVNNLGFQIDEPEKLQEEAREAAIKDAKDKANALEDDLDIRLGRIINFVESSGGIPPIMYAKDIAVAEGRGGAGGGPSLPQGTNEVTVNVTITYQIK